MARAPDQIIADIRTFEPTGGNWLPLDALLAELWDSGGAGEHTADLLSVFERFPNEDGDVLWGIMHGLEALPDYEPILVRSVLALPSEMGVLMVGRLLNGGMSQIGTVSLVELLREVAASAIAPRSVRESAARWARKHAEPARQ